MAQTKINTLALLDEKGKGANKTLSLSTVERSNSRDKLKLFLEEIGGVLAISWRHRLVSFEDQICLSMLDP